MQSYEEEVEPQHLNKRGKGALITIGYFLLLAAFMGPAAAMHMGEQAIFFAMVVAGVALAVIVLAVKLITRKIEKMQLSARGFTQVMFGVVPDAMEATADEGIYTTERFRTNERELVALPGDNDPGALPDTIIEDDPAWLADTFRPNINSLLGAMSLLCGIRRSGKSNLLAVIAEEMGRYALPMVIFDTEDEYVGLVNKTYLPRGYHVGSAEQASESPVLTNYIALDTDGAYEFGKAILDGHLQAIVNLKSWQDEDAALIMTEMIDGMNDWQEARPNKDRIPVMVFLEEAQKWLPQNTGESYVSKEQQTLLHHAFFDIVVARGGKRGFGFVAACQRYSQINKNVLQSLWKFLFLQTEDADLTRYERLGLDRADVTALRQGECFIFSPSVIGFKAMMRERYSPHMGHTPGLDDLFRHTKHLAPAQAVMSQSFSAGRPATPRPMTDEPMEDLQPARHPRTNAAKQEMERAINAYMEGATSIDKLAAALDIKPNAARQLKPKVEAEIRRRQAEEQSEGE